MYYNNKKLLLSTIYRRNHFMNTSISTTVLRAIKILNFLRDSAGPKGIKEISEALDISTTVTHRILSTLKMDGMVFQDIGSKKYSLGTVFIEYANKLITDIPAMIDSDLIKLRDGTQETVGFYMLSGLTRVCVIEHPSQQEISRRAGVGNRIPLQLGASGRTILAFLEDELKNKVLSLLPENERIELTEQLKLVSKTKFSISEEELTRNVSALSAPVFGQKGKVIGAIAISGPFFRWNKETMEEHIPFLLETAEKISKSLY